MQPTRFYQVAQQHPFHAELKQQREDKGIFPLKIREGLILEAPACDAWEIWLCHGLLEKSTTKPSTLRFGVLDSQMLVFVNPDSIPSVGELQGSRSTVGHRCRHMTVGLYKRSTNSWSETRPDHTTSSPQLPPCCPRCQANNFLRKKGLFPEDPGVTCWFHSDFAEKCSKQWWFHGL